MHPEFTELKFRIQKGWSGGGRDEPARLSLPIFSGQMDEMRTHCIRGSVQMAVNKKTNPQILCCHRRHTRTPTHPDKAGRAGTIVLCFLTSRTVPQINIFLYWSVNCVLLIQIDSGRGFLSVSLGMTVKIHLENERRTFFVVQLEDVFIGLGAPALRHCGGFRWSKQ